MRSVKDNFNDIPEPFCRNIQQSDIQEHTWDKEKKSDVPNEVNSMGKTMKTKQNDMLFLLLIMIIFYDNRF